MPAPPLPVLHMLFVLPPPTFSPPTMTFPPYPGGRRRRRQMEERRSCFWEDGGLVNFVPYHHCLFPMGEGLHFPPFLSFSPTFSFFFAQHYLPALPCPFTDMAHYACHLPSPSSCPSLPSHPCLPSHSALVTFPPASHLPLPACLPPLEERLSITLVFYLLVGLVGMGETVLLTSVDMQEDWCSV